MNLIVALLTVLLIVSASSTFAMPAGEQPKPEQGAVISQDTTFTPGTYRLNSTSLEEPALVIRGDGITVDFAGVTLVGSDDPARPDEFTGLAVKVEGNNVTVKNLTARGYKVALLARDAAKLTIADCDFSYNWRQRMKSTPWQEDLADWMSYHQNEKDEWL